MRRRKEVLVVCRRVYSYNESDGSDGKTPVAVDRSADCDRYAANDLHVAYLAAPGTGRVTHRVTRVDERGVWGVEVENTGRELQPWEVR